MKKKPFSGPAKSARKAHRGKNLRQKSVRKLDHEARVRLRLQTNLRQMAAFFKTGKHTEDCAQLARELSKIAGLSNGHVWSYRYIVSVINGKMEPSKKLINAVALYKECINPRMQQWFYFVNSTRLAAIKDRSCLREVIRTHMKERGFKMVTFKRYQQVKRKAAR